MSTLEIDVGDLHARSVEFTATELVVTLADGGRIATPLDWYPRLKSASAAQRNNFEVMPMGQHRRYVEGPTGGLITSPPNAAPSTT